ncbi:probable inactive dual specificity protein phosphatase-like At4g18593 [Pyrus communis]|uniref:probable inactive dual specificity protein phosphatase-like At4g18593 n=1 Tax=Pyrus communis TaxID=23211 RepID=UPI0035BF9F57
MTSEEIEIPSGVEAANPINGGAEETVTPAAFRCKKCRRVVASQDNVLDHKPGEGEQSWRRKPKSGGGDGGSSKSEEEGSKYCSSIFVDEPPMWMKTAVGEGAVEGKLYCGHCKSRLGCFNWAGTQCSCGAWITPAFQLHKSRLDI